MFNVATMSKETKVMFFSAKTLGQFMAKAKLANFYDVGESFGSFCCTFQGVDADHRESLLKLVKYYGGLVIKTHAEMDEEESRN